MSIGVERGSDGDNLTLTRADPERPFAGVVLSQNGDHALDRAENGSVDNDGLLLLASLVDERQIEAYRQLKVELDRGALVGATQGVHDGDVNLGSVKGTVAGVLRPRLAELVQTIGQLFLG